METTELQVHKKVWVHGPLCGLSSVQKLAKLTIHLECVGSPWVRNFLHCLYVVYDVYALFILFILFFVCACLLWFVCIWVLWPLTSCWLACHCSPTAMPQGRNQSSIIVLHLKPKNLTVRTSPVRTCSITVRLAALEGNAKVSQNNASCPNFVIFVLSVFTPLSSSLWNALFKSPTVLS